MVGQVRTTLARFIGRKLIPRRHSIPDVVFADDRKIFALDTNVLMNNAVAHYVMSGNPDALPYGEGEHIELDHLVVEEERVRSEPNDIVIPQIVEAELERIKDNPKSSPLQRRRAMLAIDFLNYARENADGDRLYAGGIELPNGARLIGLKHDERSFLTESTDLYMPSPDDRILWSLRCLVEERPALGPRLRFVTNDRALRGKSHEARIQSEPFLFERIRDPHQRYTGILERTLDEEVDQAWLRRAEIGDIDPAPLGVDPRLLNANQFVAVRANGDGAPRIYVRDPHEPKLRNLTHHKWVVDQIRAGTWLREGERPLSDLSYDTLTDHETLLDLCERHGVIEKGAKIDRIRADGFKSRQSFEHFRTQVMSKHVGKRPSQGSALWLPVNPRIIPEDEQKALVELYANDAIKVVTVDSRWGTGKTYFAMLTGLLKMQAGLYDTLMYVRPLRSGEDIGYLPGDVEEKTAPFYKPLYDSLEEIFQRHHGQSKERVERQIEHLTSHGFVQFEQLGFVKGRTIYNSYVILDDAHLFTRSELALLITRAGRGTKMVITGDRYQIESVMSNPQLRGYIDQDTAGIAHAPERLSGNPIYGHIELPETLVKRSEVALLANRL